MNTPSMEVIFLILSGVILMAGILYWFWSHIQLTQKKVQLLENAVFELRGMLANKGPESPAPIMEVAPSAHNPSPAVVYKDIKDDEEEEDWAPAVTPLESGSDLVPGGRIDVPLLTVVEEEVSLEQKLAERSQQETQFRDLFVPAISSPKTETVVTAVQQPPTQQLSSASLESMPVKDLRRLAEERGIAGAAEMRKKDILTALRSQIPTVERTIDIAELVNPKVEGEEEVVPVIDNDIKEIPILE
jgi:hypothetical protein